MKGGADYASKQNMKEYSIHIIREYLRQCAAREAAVLSRSVSRLTSYDALPCMEYSQEVACQYAIAEKLLYIQQCRSSLERCIASGTSHLCYHWRDGQVSDTRFHKTASAKIKVSGLLIETPPAGRGLRQRFCLANIR